MDFKDITYAKEEGVAYITLNRPHVLNALSPRMVNEWRAAIGEAKSDREVKVLVVTGAGHVFCSGGNPRELLATRSSIVEARKKSLTTELLLAMANDLSDMDKPYIAAVNGAAVGAGMDMASMCDIRIASEKARFSMAFARMGEIPTAGGCFSLPRIVGIANACELIWTAKMIDAREALRIGYVSKVVPPEELMAAAKELAARIARGPTVAIQLSKRLIYRCWELDQAAANTAMSTAEFIAHATDDAKEGPRAWVEKREPIFKGK